MKTWPVRRYVKSCLADAGDHEHPLGSNDTKYGVRFGWNRVAWCLIYLWCKYTTAGVRLPLKTASCVAIYDDCEKSGMLRAKGKGRVADGVIRTWQHLARHAPGFNPSQTHAQTILKVKRMGRTARHPLGTKYYGLWGGNQGAGYVGPQIEWVPADDPSILGVLAFRSLFCKAAKKQPAAPETKRDTKTLPAPKSHKRPKVGKPSRAQAVEQTKRQRREKREAAAWRRLVRKIKRRW